MTQPSGGARGGHGQRERRVLLIGWDAADWKMLRPLMDAGEMPNMKRFVDEGVSGNVATLQPVLSPILWTSVATGKHADKHGVLGFAEPDGSSGGIRPVTSTSRRSHALWNIVSEAGLRAGVVNWYASHPAEAINGFVVSDRFAHATGPLKRDEPDMGWPPPTGSMHPEELLEPLARLRVHPAMTTRAQVDAFVRRSDELDHAAEPKIGELRTLLAHCATVHNAATALMQDETWDFMGIYYDAIDRFAHSFMEFNPPRMEHVSERDFQHYCDVMRECYKLHDLMLGRLMNLAGEDTVVVILSDHGFHSDHLRPAGSSAIKGGRPVAWHRTFGVLAAWGPGIKGGESIYGASLLDIAPTVLTMLGLPVGEDMDGQTLRQIFKTPPGVQTVPSHEPSGEDKDTAAAEEDPWVAQQMLEQLKALGYVGEDNTEGVVVDRERNLAQVYASTGRPELAAEKYRELIERRPDEPGFRIGLAQMLMTLRRYDEVEEVLAELPENESLPRKDLFRGMIAHGRGQNEVALDHLRRVAEIDSEQPRVHAQLGSVHLAREELEEARAAFERALEIDPENAEALDGLGVVYRRLKMPQEAVLAHMRSVALLHYRPRSHVNLGLALAEAGRPQWAAEAFRVALSQNPDMAIAHRCLAQLCERAFGQPERARSHRQRAAEIAAGTPHH